MLFTLTTLKNMENGIWCSKKIKRLSTNAFVCARRTFRYLLMVTDRALKLDYASVIFVDPGFKIHETYLNYIPQLLPAICKVSGSP